MSITALGAGAEKAQKFTTRYGAINIRTECLEVVGVLKIQEYSRLLF